MKNFLLLFTLFLGHKALSYSHILNDANAKKLIHLDSSNIDKFKSFVKGYLSAVVLNDTAYLRVHTKFPIENSDFGALLGKAGRNLKKVSSADYFRYLQKFYPPELVSRIREKAEYGKFPGNASESEYYCSLEQPLKNATDLLETYRWVFKKKGNDYVLISFIYKVN